LHRLAAATGGQNLLTVSSISHVPGPPDCPDILSDSAGRLAEMITGYSASGNNANGSAECFFGASSTENLICKIYEASLASVTASNLNYVNKTDSTQVKQTG
jgi:hypothetical protein